MDPITDHTPAVYPAASPARWGIHLNDAGKRFNRDWIFRHFTYHFQQRVSYAVTGPNGSGKSTLLQAIAGSLHLNEGEMVYRIDAPGQEQNIAVDAEYQYIALVAPYLELIEEMTAAEFLRFHSHFKPLTKNIDIPEILSLISLEKAKDKQIRYFSSGMKQRLKLAQAVFSDVPVLLLDEPCTNLDTAGYDLYHRLIRDHCGNKLIIVSSNDANEMDFCEKKIAITDFK